MFVSNGTKVKNWCPMMVMDGKTGAVVVAWEGFTPDCLMRLSPDRNQRWLYDTDLGNDSVWVLDRAMGMVAARIGRAGHGVGEEFLEEREHPEQGR